ncbi:VWA domain-containing protein [Desulfofundulus sp.]|uniref:VWA domain-containing protein n=1 Tax=Desulfofundulus sp. TaxID=2282750 RepID=UPI003C750192
MLDLFKALPLLEPTRENLLLVMQTTLIKEIGQERILEKLFDLYWATLKQRAKNQEQPGKKFAMPVVPPRLSPEEFNAKLAQMKEWLRQALNNEDGLPAGNGDPAGQGGSRGYNTGQGQKSEHFQVGSTVPLEAAGQKVAMTLAKDRSEGDLKSLAREVVLTIIPLAEETTGENYREMLKQLRDWLERFSVGKAEKLRRQENLLELEHMLKHEIEKLQCQSQPKKLSAIAREANLYERCFAELDPEQVIQVKKQVARLGRRLATRAGYRRIPSTRGAVDIKRTVRLATTTGGIPIILCHQDRQATRPDLVVLCDVSGSVAPYSQFMLLLVHAMQSKFRLVRSYAFVDAIAEVTAYLKKEMDIERVMRNIQRQTGIWRTGFSDYGAVWRQFFHEHLHILHKKVTLIILGDARNNYKPPGEDYFREICQRVRRVIWLNPAPRESWSLEDSIMHLYTPYCQYVFECCNLSQLTRIANQIF